MAERQPIFNNEELNMIVREAINLSRLGEDAVFALHDSATKLLVNIASSKRETIIIETAKGEIELTKNEARHKADVIYETARRARVILQFEGRDGVSLRDRYFQAAGMGSLFDPDSEASKAARLSGWY